MRDNGALRSLLAPVAGQANASIRALNISLPTKSRRGDGVMRRPDVNCLWMPTFQTPKTALVAVIPCITAASLFARPRRSFDLNAARVRLDTAALQFMSSTVEGPIVIIAHQPLLRTAKEYEGRLISGSEARLMPEDREVLFLEVVIDGHFDYEKDLQVRGVVRHGYRILETRGPAVPATIAAVLLHIRDVTGLVPHVLFRPTWRKPFGTMLRFLPQVEGKAASVTRELLQNTEPDASKRPKVYSSRTNGITDAGT